MKNEWSNLSIIGMACACISVLFLPPLFGIAAIILGIIAANNGDPNGRTVWILGIILMILGMIIGVLFAASMVSASTLAVLPLFLV
jgi:hypothetical protein